MTSRWSKSDLRISRITEILQKFNGITGIQNLVRAPGVKETEFFCKSAYIVVNNLEEALED